MDSTAKKASKQMCSHSRTNRLRKYSWTRNGVMPGSSRFDISLIVTLTWRREISRTLVRQNHDIAEIRPLPRKSLWLNLGGCTSGALSPGPGNPDSTGRAFETLKRGRVRVTAFFKES